MNGKPKNAWEDISVCESVSSICSSASTAEDTAGNDVSSFLFEDCRDDTFSTKLRCKHWLSVGHLSFTTTDADLKSLFYPYGADEAFTVWEGATMIGFVGFDSPETAELAEQKMHAFIPRRQSQALAVRAISLETVSHALSKMPKTLLSALYSECATQGISAMIRRSKSPVAIAGDVAVEVTRASAPIIRRIVTALSDLSPRWSGLAFFKEELQKLLLRFLLEASEHNGAQAINCGLVAGSLFQMGMITDDPYCVATQLLQKSERRLAQLEGICALAHTCALLPEFHISRASFWAQVADIATKVKDSETSQSLLSHLRRFTKTTSHAAAVPIVSQLSCAPSSPSFSTALNPPVSVVRHEVAPRRLPALRPRQDEMKRRTIYVSHLPGLLPQCMLHALLTSAGDVNKVRICAGASHATLFAFVEMRTVEGAQRAMCMNGLQLMGLTIRVQMARSPVQDVLKEDARFDPYGDVVQPCLFGVSQVPLSKSLSPVF